MKMSANTAPQSRQRLAGVLTLTLSLLAGCGGGGSGDPAEPAPPAAPSALSIPSLPTASGDTVVQAVYQAGVRELSTASGAPQLLQREADGSLVFSAAPGASVGQVLIVAGRAYLVTGVDASGTRLSTRAPEMGEVFASLRIRATVQEASVMPATAAWARPLASPLASATASTSFAAELGSLGPVDLSYKGQLAMKLNLDLDFTAGSGFKTFDLSGDLIFTQTLLLQLMSSAADGSTRKGLELARFRYVIPQTLGLAQVEVPVMLEAQAGGDAKLEMRVIDGETRAHVALHYDPASGQLQSNNRIDASAASQAPTGTPAIAKSTTSLSLQLKVGPDLQLKLLETISPLSASWRALVGVSAQLVATGQRNCLGWKSELSLEASGKLKLGAQGDIQGAVATTPWLLGSGGDLAACDAPPNPTPNPTPKPDPVPVPADGLALLPLPVGAQPLAGYRLALVPDTGLPLSAADLSQQFNVNDACFSGGIYDVTDPAYHSGSPPVEMARYCVQTLEPQLLGPDGRRIHASTAIGQDWLLRFGFDPAALQVRCAVELLDPLMNLFGDGGLHYTRRRGEMVASPLLSRTPPNNVLSGLFYAWAPAKHGNQFSLVCQMEMTERSSGLHYYLRSPLWVSPAGRFIYGNNVGVIWNWHGS